MRNHAKTILKELHKTKSKLTATDFSYISNPNQYFCELEDAGLIVSEWGEKGSARVKLRYINNSNIAKVEKVLGVA